MDYRIELLIIPVSDPDRSKAFYEEQMGWHCDVDHAMGDEFRVIQMTPPGSACSVTFGVGMAQADPAKAGTYSGMHLCVRDIAAAIDDLKSRGVPVGEPYHFSAAGKTPGLHPSRGRYETFAEIPDPDGNLWVLQEVNDNPSQPPS